MKKVVIIVLCFGLVQSLFCQTWQLQWQNCFGGTETDYATDVVCLNQGYYKLGHTKSDDGDMHPFWHNLLRNRGIVCVGIVTKQELEKI